MQMMAALRDGRTLRKFWVSPARLEALSSLERFHLLSDFLAGLRRGLLVGLLSCKARVRATCANLTGSRPSTADSRTSITVCHSSRSCMLRGSLST
jgi:hypothetical protein